MHEHDRLALPFIEKRDVDAVVGKRCMSFRSRECWVATVVMRGGREAYGILAPPLATRGNGMAALADGST